MNKTENTNKSKSYELLFSDLDMGHPDLGWMPRSFKNGDDEADEDVKFERFLTAKGIKARVFRGVALVHG